jgi:hypothetical protein
MAAELAGVEQLADMFEEVHGAAGFAEDCGMVRNVELGLDGWGGVAGDEEDGEVGELSAVVSPSPEPLPTSFVVKNGSKRFWRVAWSMPWPVSRKAWRANLRGVHRHVFRRRRV